MAMEELISANRLNIGYRLGRRRVKSVCSDLDFALHTGEMVCLMGLNGTGKSTLIRTLSGAISPLGGELAVAGNIGIVLTERTNAGGLSVYDLVSLGRYRHTGFFGNLTDADDEVIQKAMESVGILPLAERHLSELSDGEKQKAFIAKALAQESRILILDEPTAFLDVRSRRETMQLLKRLAHEEGKGVIVSTHDLDLAVSSADTLWLLSRTGPLVCGAPADLDASGVLESFFGISGNL